MDETAARWSAARGNARRSPARSPALRRGAGGVVVIEGEPGIGKSRLLAHLAAQAGGCGVLGAPGRPSTRPTSRTRCWARGAGPRRSPRAGPIATASTASLRDRLEAIAAGRARSCSASTTCTGPTRRRSTRSPRSCTVRRRRRCCSPWPHGAAGCRRCWPRALAGGGGVRVLARPARRGRGPRAGGRLRDRRLRRQRRQPVLPRAAGAGPRPHDRGCRRRVGPGRRDRRARGRARRAARCRPPAARRRRRRRRSVRGRTRRPGGRARRGRRTRRPGRAALPGARPAGRRAAALRVPPSGRAARDLRGGAGRLADRRPRSSGRGTRASWRRPGPAGASRRAGSRSRR